MKKIILIGGGGHCKSVIDVIEAEKKYSIIGIIDNLEHNKNDVLGYKVIGTDNNLAEFVDRVDACIVAIGQIKSAMPRIVAFERINALNLDLATIIAPTAYISQHSRIGSGTIVMHGAFINSSVSVGQNCILNTGCLIEHDCFIGLHTHISTGAKVNGGAIIGNRCFVGSGAVLKNGVHIDDDVIIGAGVTVKTDVPAGSVLR
jgi:sugar O-acyltransferase (sialic acid O-acetyltransferase NeuD family)